MSVAAITALIATLQPFLGGTAIGGVLAIATPARISRILRAVKVITGITGLASYSEEEKKIAKAYADRRNSNQSMYLATRDW